MTKNLIFTTADIIIIALFLLLYYNALVHFYTKYLNGGFL